MPESIGDGCFFVAQRHGQAAVIAILACALLLSMVVLRGVDDAPRAWGPEELLVPIEAEA